MPGPLLHQGAIVTCAHAGQAQPLVPNPRVLVNGMPTATIAGPWAIVGCPLVPPAPGPCLTAQFVTSALRLTSTGQPLLLMDSQALCAPGATPLLPVMVQTRVIGM
jgi:hypothetical protein